MLSFPTQMLVSFVNAGGQPLVIAVALKARAQAMEGRPEIPDDVKQRAKIEAEAAAQPMREVARFRRTANLPIQPRAGLALRGVGPLLFEPCQIEYDVETGEYKALEIIQLCHTSGPCKCQEQVRAYMGDARWQMLDVYGDVPKPVDVLVPCAACQGSGATPCPDAPRTCRCVPDVLRHKCPTCKGAGKVAKPAGGSA
jgi:hypothetical protein